MHLVDAGWIYACLSLGALKSSRSHCVAKDLERQYSIIFCSALDAFVGHALLSLQRNVNFAKEFIARRLSSLNNALNAVMRNRHRTMSDLVSLGASRSMTNAEVEQVEEGSAQQCELGRRSAI